MNQEFDDFSKLAAIEREIDKRRVVYPGQVKRGVLSQHEADRQIAIMKAIADDYRIKLQPKLV